MSFQLPVSFERVSRRKDKSVSLTFTSNFEISTEEFSEMDRLLQTVGWCIYQDNEAQVGDIPDEPAMSKEGKSKSQRLRAIHFLLWRQSGTDEPFEVWFDRRFESIMNQLKGKLDE